MTFYEYEGTKQEYYRALKDCILLFVAAVVIGSIACIAVAGLAMHFIHQSQTSTSVAVVSKVAAQTGSPFVHFLALFFNNLLMCILMLAIPHGIQRKWGKYLVFGSIISLGILTGAVILVVTAQHNAVFTASSLIPHGIPELAAFFICTAYAVMLMRQESFYQSRPISELWKNSWSKLMSWIIPLVLMAALIETFITPILMAMAA